MSLTLLCVGCGDAAPTIDRPDQPVWCPANVPTRQAFDARMLLGLSPDAGRGDAERQGCAFRVVMEDGEPQGGTADVREDRVEAVVDDDVVIEVRSADPLLLGGTRSGADATPGSPRVQAKPAVCSRLAPSKLAYIAALCPACCVRNSNRFFVHDWSSV